MNPKDEMLEGYDFSNSIRGKYAQAYKEGYVYCKNRKLWRWLLKRGKMWLWR